MIPPTVGLFDDGDVVEVGQSSAEGARDEEVLKGRPRDHKSQEQGGKGIRLLTGTGRGRGKGGVD